MMQIKVTAPAQIYTTIQLPSSKSISRNIAEQLDAVSGTNRLVLVEFYADWSPHYEWLEPVVRTYEKQVSEVIKVNIVEDKAVADSFNIETAPAFILLQRGHELWRQVGELTIDELKLVLEEFK